MILVVFSDLDGTLLDHDTYSFAAAQPALERLAELNSPVVLVTSKTRAEVEVIRRQLGLEGPFVTENGGGIFFPEQPEPPQLAESVEMAGYTAIVLGRPYAEARAFIEERQQRFSIEGFGDMSPQRISELTGLSLGEAELAAKREFTEPFLLERGEDLEPLSREAAHEGFSITTGGRLYHLVGDHQDKGAAVEIVSRFYRREADGAILTVGLGDSPNDLPMLEVVDIPVVIPRPSGETLELSRTDSIQATAPGSRGWNEAMNRLLSQVYSA